MEQSRPRVRRSRRCRSVVRCQALSEMGWANTAWFTCRLPVSRCANVSAPISLALAHAGALDQRRGGVDDPGQRADRRGIVVAEVRLDPEHSSGQPGLAVDGHSRVPSEGWMPPLANASAIHAVAWLTSGLAGSARPASTSSSIGTTRPPGSSAVACRPTPRPGQERTSG